MSILNKFLMQTAIVTSLVTISLIAIPVTEARADRGEFRVAKNHNGTKMAIASRNNNPRMVRNNRSNRQASYYNNNNHRVNVRNNRQRYKAPVHRRINNNYNTYNTYNSYNKYNRNHRYDRHYRYSNRHGSNNRSFITGLVGGAVLFSALNNNYNYGYGYSNYGYSNSGYSNYAYAGYGYPSYGYPNYNYYNRPRTKVVYVDRPVIQQVPVQAPAYTQQAKRQAVDTSCLQTREYTTNINVGGQTVPAYGQACLQPDGSWKFGEATPAPNF